MEEDYKVLKDNLNDSKYGMSHLSEKEITEMSSIGSLAFSSCLLPEIKKEVNTGCHFATTRQIFYSLILARWYKSTIKESLINNIYTDKEKISGLEDKDHGYAAKIYDHYVEAMSKGVYHYIREDYEPITREVIPRKYFSGGILASAIKEKLEINNATNDIQLNDLLGRDHKCFLVKVRLDLEGGGSSGASMGNYSGDSLAGIDFTANKVNVTRYGEKLLYDLGEDIKRKLSSDEFKGFVARIEDVLPLNTVSEIEKGTD